MQQEWNENGRMPILMEMLSYFAVSGTRQILCQAVSGCEIEWRGNAHCCWHDAAATVVSTRNFRFDGRRCGAIHAHVYSFDVLDSYLFSVHFNTFRRVGRNGFAFMHECERFAHFKINGLTANVSISRPSALRTSRLSAKRSSTALSQFLFHFQQNETIFTFFHCLQFRIH